MTIVRWALATPARKVAVGLLAAVVLATAWWLGSPLFINKAVDEQFPMSANAVVPDSMTRAQVEEVMAGMAMVEETVTEGMPSGGPKALLTGSFRDADSFHKGSGRATIYQLEDGTRVLRLEDFEVTNGPDLRVLLSTHGDPQERGQVTGPGYVELGKLKGNIGNQNYEIPTGLEIASFGSVVIYCKPFHVIFSVAPLQPS